MCVCVNVSTVLRWIYPEARLFDDIDTAWKLEIFGIGFHESKLMMIYTIPIMHIWYISICGMVQRMVKYWGVNFILMRWLLNILTPKTLHKTSNNDFGLFQETIGHNTREGIKENFKFSSRILSCWKRNCCSYEKPLCSIRLLYFPVH